MEKQEAWIKKKTKKKEKPDEEKSPKMSSPFHHKEHPLMATESFRPTGEGLPCPKLKECLLRLAEGPLRLTGVFRPTESPLRLAIDSFGTMRGILGQSGPS